jgi:dipeptidyl aminopeptidase/acylaminoacyl peptidase
MRSTLVSLAAVLLVLPAAAATEAPGFDDFTRLTYPSLARISPDGRQVLAVVADPNGEHWPESEIWLADLVTGSARRFAAPADNPRWSPDGGRIAWIAGGHLLVAAADGGEPRPVKPDGLQPLDYEWSPDGERIAWVGAAGEPATAQLHVADLATGAVRQVTEVGFSLAVSPWDPEGNLSWSPDGNRIAFAGKPTAGFDDDFSSSIHVVDVATGAVTRLTRRDGMNLRPEWSPDGRHVAYRSTFGLRDRFANHGLAVVAADGGPPRDLAGDLGLGYLDGPYAYEWAPDSKSILFTAAHRGAVVLHRLDVASGESERLSGAGDVVSRFTLSGDGRHVAFLHTSAEAPWRIAHAALPGLDLQAVRGLPTATLPGERSVPRRVSWRSSDGLEIEALLHLPAGDGPFPLLTVLHGGPEGQFHVGVVPEVPFPLPLVDVYSPQVYTAHGWAVLLPNFRGSGGYGEKLRRAAQTDWSGGFAGDVLAGVERLVEQGIADPDRLVLGGSWRSGATKVVSLLTGSDHFAAATILSAYPDMEANDARRDDFHLQHWGLFGGSPEQAPEAWAKHSPIHRVGEIETPSLIAHDENDFFIPASQSIRLHEALGEAGVPGELILYRRLGFAEQAELGRRILAFHERWTRDAESEED